MRFPVLVLSMGLSAFAWSFSLPGVDDLRVTVVDKPDNTLSNHHYLNNRAPLRSLYLYKLPVGSIRPGGWLGRKLEQQSVGLTGKLGDISPWLRKDSSAWLSPNGVGPYGWEELPYWLKGYGNIGYVLGKKDMIDEARTWIEGVFHSQRAAGDFGPILYRNGHRDLWANMLMLFTLQSYHEYCHDPRVIGLMTKYFRWQLSLPDSVFLKDYWENSRGGDNLYSVYWLYNQTGDSSLLRLAEKIHRNTANWEQGTTLPNWHNVNIAQCFREPATYWLLSGRDRDLRATYEDFDLIRARFGQVPGGMFGSDENSRPGYDDPRQCVETCGMLEQMASDEMLFRFTSDPKWAENGEDVAFNTYPAAFMPDQKALRYLTAPNMAVSDSKDHSPGIDNPGPYLMMNPFSSRCCQHNHSSGWVYFAENLTMATPDDGLAAVFYATSTARAVVGKSGDTVSISEETHYPFDENIGFTMHAARTVAFPFYLRIPSWAQDAEVMVNGRPVNVKHTSGKWIRLERKWKEGDRVGLRLPMTLRTRTWTSNKNSVSIDYGPLTWSLKIREEYKLMESSSSAQWDSKWLPGTDRSQWPSFEILPASSWNYGLVWNDNQTLKDAHVQHKAWPKDEDPFTVNGSPLELTLKGRRIPSWGIDAYGLTAVLPQSPVVTDQPEETITLIPMGSARLRISAFPVVK